MKSLGVVLGCVLTFILPAAGQISGTQTLVRLPGNFDKASRVAGFSIADTYYIAYNNGESGASSTVPALYYGSSTASTATPPTLTFGDATQMNLPNLSHSPNIAHMTEATAEGQATIFQFRCQRNNGAIQSASYESIAPSPIAGSAPIIGTKTEVSPILYTGLFTLHLYDVASASLYGKMYLFLLSGGSSKPNAVRLWSYDGPGSGGPVYQTSVTFGGIGADTQSVDATNVTLASGEQAIVLTAVSIVSGKTQVAAYLLTRSSTGTLQPVMMANPPGKLGTGSIRIAYGPASGTSKVNSITMFYGGVDGGAFGGTTYFYTSQLALPASLESGSISQIGGWTQQKANMWDNGTGNPEGNQFPYAWTAFSTPKKGAQVQNTVDNKTYYNVNQFITLMQAGSAVTLLHHRNSFISSLAIQLQADASTAGTTWDSSQIPPNDTDADVQAIVQSWSLLGVITGLPPIPAGTPVGMTLPVLTLGYGTSTKSATQTNQTTVVSTKVSGNANNGEGGINASAGYTQSTSEGKTSSSMITLGVSLPFQPENGNYDYEQTEGFLVVSQPTYETANYTAFAYDGTTPLGISTESITLPDAVPVITTVPFLLTDPTQPIAGYPACIYASFPVDAGGNALVTYPLTTDIPGWYNRPVDLTNSTNMVQNLDYFTVASTESHGGSAALSSTSLTNYTAATSNKIAVGTGVSFLGIGTSFSSSVKISSTQDIVFGTKESSNIAYPQMVASQGYTYMDVDVYFERLADGQTGANWMPTIFTGSRPWIMTWQVSGYGLTSGATVGSGSGPTKPCPKPQPKPQPKPTPKPWFGW